jgi:peptide/nickel transport system substrate-binding protein
VMRLDPHSGRVNKTVHLGGTPDALAAGGGTVWVAVAPPPPSAAVPGGVLRLTSQAPSAALDPALAVGFHFSYATCAGLVTYPDKSGAAGSRVVPEIAEAVPTATKGGTTYTFKIRPGFRFSPPSNEEVTAATFKATLERELDPRMKSPLAGGLSGIVGYDAYVAGKTRRLSGVTAQGSTLTIRLSRPDGGFLATLAGGAACAVPIGTPVDPNGINDVSSAGPYFVASYTPRQQVVLRRNPNYHGGRPRHFDRIVVTLGVDPAQALREIQAGTADYALDGLPSGVAPRLLREFGPRSKAAKAGHQQYFISPALSAFYLHMNTSRPLFADVRLRRAVNYALDRPALVAEGRRYANSGPFNPAQPSDRYLPTSIDSASTVRVYPVDGPDLRQAKRLAAHTHATAVMYTPNVPPWLQEAQIIRRNLKPLGIDVDVKQFPIRDFFSRIIRPGERFDLAVSGWATNADPSGALVTFGNKTLRQGVVDFSYFDNPAFDRQLEAAAKLSGPNRYRRYGKLELELMRKFVPAAPFASGASNDFFSARIGCQLYQPLWGMDLGALCLRRNSGR